MKVFKNKILGFMWGHSGSTDKVGRSIPGNKRESPQGSPERDPMASLEKSQKSPYLEKGERTIGRSIEAYCASFMCLLPGGRPPVDLAATE
jgi:hypothetical protein